MVGGFPTIAVLIQPEKLEHVRTSTLKLWNVSTQLVALSQEAPISPKFLQDFYHSLYKYIGQEQIKRIVHPHLCLVPSLLSGTICYHVFLHLQSVSRLLCCVDSAWKIKPYEDQYTQIVANFKGYF
jgi:hypothetical protein